MFGFLDNLKCLCGIHEPISESWKTKAGIIHYTRCSRCGVVDEGTMIHDGQTHVVSASDVAFFLKTAESECEPIDPKMIIPTAVRESFTVNK